MWGYVQRTGEWWHGGPARFATGYSGAEPDGKNNPAMQSVPNIGPLPVGFYTIDGPPFDDPEHGRYCLRLTPDPSNEMYGRAGFLLHGDSINHPGCASKGCTCLSPIVWRMAIWNSEDNRLQVVAETAGLPPEISGAPVVSEENV